MEWNEINEALKSGMFALDLLLKAKNLMPESKEKQAAAAALDEASRTFKMAEAKIARELGYEICRCTWPPQIALERKDGSIWCPLCEKNVDESNMLPPAR